MRMRSKMSTDDNELEGEKVWVADDTDFGGQYLSTDISLQL